jgi:hypothetical protein
VSDLHPKLKIRYEIEGVCSIPFWLLLFWTYPLRHRESIKLEEALIVLMPLKSWLLCI